MIAVSMFSASPRYQSLHQRRKSFELDNGRLSLAHSDNKNGDHKLRKDKIIPKSATSTAPKGTESHARRFPSPTIGRTTNIHEITKRATSAERKRSDVSSSSDSKPSNNTREAPKRLWPSSQIMSSSMQSDASSVSSSSGRGLKETHRNQGSDYTLRPAANGIRRSTERSPLRKPTPERNRYSERNVTMETKGTPERKGETPERKRTPVRLECDFQTENARPSENQHYRPDMQRWPSTSSTRASASTPTKRAESTGKTQNASSEAKSFLVEGKSMKTLSRTTIPSPQLRSVSKCSIEGVVLPPSQTIARRLVLESNRRATLISDGIKSSESNRETGEKDNDSISSFHLLEHSIHVRQSTEEAKLASTGAPPSQLESISDSDSVSPGGSGVISGHDLVPSVVRASGSKKLIDGTTVSARLWHELGSRVRRLSEGHPSELSVSESELSLVIGGKGLSKTNIASLGPLSFAKAITNGAGSLFNAAWALSPRRSPLSFSNTQTPELPSVQTKLFQPSSPSRRISSPTRPRGSNMQTTPGGSQVNRAGITPSFLNFGSESFKRKKSLGQFEEAFSLRILHNRWLEWRFINARSGAVMDAQNAAAEEYLYNASVQTIKLLSSVTVKRIQLQQAKHATRLNIFLAAHRECLEEYELLQQEHLAALFGAKEALSASILKVPITTGARADLQAMREACSYALDVMNALDFSVRRLEPKVGRTTALICEVANITLEEVSLLHNCGSLIENLAGLEIEERSLKNHFMQLDL